MKRLLLVLALASWLTTATVAGGAGAAFPKRIALPDGFQPEGITTAGERFYVGSISTGGVYGGSLRTGRGAVLVRPRAGRSAIGLEEDRGRLFVAGGETGRAFVYDARTGTDVAVLQLASGGGSFVNDVAVVRGAAWFTDSFEQVLYKVPLARDGQPRGQASVRAIRLTGDFELQGGFNTNGIDATADGATLVIVQSSTGTLFAVDPKTGVSRTIDLGGERVPNGDGILLDGLSLYVVQNQLNVVTKIALQPDLASGRVLRRISARGLDVPTTVDQFGNRLYAVNARFGTLASRSTKYWITGLPK